MEFVIMFAFLSTLGLIRRMKKHTPPITIQQQEEIDELITVILPTINDKK